MENTHIYNLEIWKRLQEQSGRSWSSLKRFCHLIKIPDKSFPKKLLLWRKLGGMEWVRLHWFSNEFIRHLMNYHNLREEDAMGTEVWQRMIRIRKITVHCSMISQDESSWKNRVQETCNLLFGYEKSCRCNLILAASVGSIEIRVLKCFYNVNFY